MTHTKINFGYTRLVLIAIIALILCLVALLLYTPTVAKNAPSTNAQISSQSTTTDPFLKASTSATAIFVYNPETSEILYEKNAQTELPLASITKIMTAIIALESTPATSTVILERDFLKNEGDSGLLVGEKWSLEDLIPFSLIVSSNDGMDAVAAHIGSKILNQNLDTGRKTFVNRMNNKAVVLGLTRTKFFNPTGLDLPNGTNGAYGSAQDVAKMLWYGYQKFPEIFSKTGEHSATFVSLSNKKHTALNTNTLTSNPTNVIIASKTGFTDIAGGNLAIIFETSNSQFLVAVVLGSTYDGRFNDMQQVIDLAKEKISQK